jgi:O-succinylbenzoic acid--CoA ligase
MLWMHPVFENRGASPALVLDGLPLSHRELLARIQGVAGQLRAAGLKPGMALGVVAPDAWHGLLLMCACLQSGLVYCPINPAFSVPERTAAMRMMGVQALWIPGGKGLDIDFSIANTHEDRYVPAGLDRPVSRILTSGTSGQPRAVQHSFVQHQVSAEGSKALIPLGPGDRWWLSLPLFHIGGYAIPIRCLLSGATLVLDRRPIEPMTVLSTNGITHLSLVNTQLYRLMQLPQTDYRPRACLLGGGPLSEQTLARATQREWPLFQSYGLSEMASQVATGPPGGCGYVLPGRQLRLRDGEIQVRGRTLMQGYFSYGRLTRPVTADGWFATGDLGRMTPRGLQVTGRLGNRFVSGGENICPEQIERVLMQYPGVSQALVVPVEDVEFGQRPVAFVDMDTALPSIELLRAFLQDRLARFMHPVALLPWPETAVKGIKPDRQAMGRLAANHRADTSKPRDEARL